MGPLTMTLSRTALSVSRAVAHLGLAWSGPTPGDDTPGGGNDHYGQMHQLWCPPAGGSPPTWPSMARSRRLEAPFGAWPNKLINPSSSGDHDDCQPERSQRRSSEHAATRTEQTGDRCPSHAGHWMRHDSDGTRSGHGRDSCRIIDTDGREVDGRWLRSIIRGSSAG